MASPLLSSPNYSQVVTSSVHKEKKTDDSSELSPSLGNQEESLEKEGERTGNAMSGRPCRGGGERRQRVVEIQLLAKNKECLKFADNVLYKLTLKP